jgi:hypothetical protein
MVFNVFRRYKMRYNAIGAVTKMLKEFLASETALQTLLPGAIYEDPYVFGYLGEVAMVGADLANATLAQNKLSLEDRARVARGAIVAIAGIKGYHGAKNLVSLRREEFLEGKRQAHKMMAVMCGQLGPEDDAEIAEAFRGALCLEPRRLIEGSSTAEVAARRLRRAHFSMHIERRHQRQIHHPT